MAAWDTKCKASPHTPISKIYIGQAGPFRAHRVKGVSSVHADKSAVAEHSINQGHLIQLHNSSILATKTGYMDRIVIVAIEIELPLLQYQQRG
jgi:hypothetical protein